MLRARPCAEHGVFTALNAPFILPPQHQLTIGHDEIFGLICRGIQFKAQERFDSVFCTNDWLAAGAAATLENLHLREKVKVIDYDNILPFLSSNGKFPTIAINLEEMGRRAITCLIDTEPLPKALNIAPQLILR